MITTLYQVTVTFKEDDDNEFNEKIIDLFFKEMDKHHTEKVESDTYNDVELLVVTTNLNDARRFEHIMKKIVVDNGGTLIR